MTMLTVVLVIGSIVLFSITTYYLGKLAGFSEYQKINAPLKQSMEEYIRTLEKNLHPEITDKVKH